MHSNFLSLQHISQDSSDFDRAYPGLGASVSAQDPDAPGSHIASIAAENRELRAEIEQIRAERNRLAETQRRMMELLHCSNADKIVHDLRNVLNERDLMKALVDDM